MVQILGALPKQSNIGIFDEYQNFLSIQDILKGAQMENNYEQHTGMDVDVDMNENHNESLMEAAVIKEESPVIKEESPVTPALVQEEPAEPEPEVEPKRKKSKRDKKDKKSKKKRKDKESKRKSKREKKEKRKKRKEMAVDSDDDEIPKTKRRKIQE